MFRPTVLFNAASRVAAVRAPVSRTVAPAVFTRLYSAGHASVESRVLDILRGFDKIDESKVRFHSNTYKFSMLAINHKRRMAILKAISFKNMHKHMHKHIYIY